MLHIANQRVRQVGNDHRQECCPVISHRDWSTCGNIFVARIQQESQSLGWPQAGVCRTSSHGICPEIQKVPCEQIIEKTKLKAENIGCGETTQENLISTAKQLFTDDSKLWPLHYSLYYLGQIPCMGQLISDPNINLVQRRCLESHIATDWHFPSIRLAGRIFCDFQKWMAVLNKCLNQKL